MFYVFMALVHGESSRTFYRINKLSNYLGSIRFVQSHSDFVQELNTPKPMDPPRFPELC